MEEKKYITEFKNFIDSYQQGAVSAEAIGEMVVRLAQYFAETNLKLSVRDKMVNDIAARIAQGTDETTGKAITVAKTDLLIKATPEANACKESKIDLQNIEQYINALKCLQKGVLNEYSHVGQ